MPGFDRILDSCHDRWRRGAEDFTRLLGSTTRLPGKKTVRSAIYGNMEFDGKEMRFIESFYLQRLRHVSQMGLLHLVYPDARHSRFEHSLGVLHSLKGLLSADPSVRNALSQDERNTLYFAALLHDCGHGPFSHTTETLLEIAGLDVQLRPEKHGEGSGVKPHERRCRDLVEDTDFHRANLNIASYGLKQALENFDVNPAHVVDLVLGKKPAVLLNLLSGDFDVDKMDYFRRDAFFTGTLGGGVDMEVMQRWVRIFDKGRSKVASYDDRLVGHLLHMLYSRHHVYNVTAYHPAARTAAALVIIAGDLALRTLPPTTAATIFSNIELCDDREWLSILEIAAAEGTHPETRLLQRVIQRLHLRRLPKRLASLTRIQFKDQFAACIPQLESEEGELPHLAYTKISSIADGKYLRLLGGARDDVAILEMTPQLGSIRRGIAGSNKEADTLKGINISGGSASSAVTLYEWLEANAGKGSGEAQARALRSYRLSLWRALVLVPASLRIALKDESLEAKFVQDFAEALADPSLCRPMAQTRGSWNAATGRVGKKLRKWRTQLAV